MVTLRIDIPDHIYRMLAEQAKRERRSISQQTLTILDHGLELHLDHKTRRRAVLRKIQACSPAGAHKLSDPVELIRQDRRK